MRSHAPTTAKQPTPAAQHTEAEPEQAEREPQAAGAPAAGHRFEQLPPEPAGGTPLPAPVRRKMERAFGADFGGVRVREGREAPALGALAYTRGERLHFAPGQYDPASPAGQTLIGHELVHVVQQRAGRVAAPQGKGMPVNADPALEAQADALGARAAAGGMARVPGAHGGATPGATAGGIVQLKKKFTDEDVDKKGPNKDKIAGGAINQVDLVTYNEPIGHSMRTGFFKKDLKPVKQNFNQQWVDKNNLPIDVGAAAEATGVTLDDPRLANRAVATSRYADLLTTTEGVGPGGVIARTEFAAHNGEEGSVSEKALGRPMKESVHSQVTAPAVLNNLQGRFAQDYMIDQETKKELFRKGDPTQAIHPAIPDVREKPDKFYKLNDYDYYHKFDLSKPETQKGLADLQIMDALTGQVDRHGGNIFIDENGKVTGIDHDASFGKNISDPRALKHDDTIGSPTNKSHNRGLPSLVDANTAKMVKKLKEKDVRKELTGLLSEEEIKATLKRLKVVKKHIADLKKNKGIVGSGKKGHPEKWGSETYQTILNQGADNSYLAHLEDSYRKAAARGPLHAEGLPIWQTRKHTTKPNSQQIGAARIPNPQPNVNPPLIVANQPPVVNRPRANSGGMPASRLPLGRRNSLPSHFAGQVATKPQPLQIGLPLARGGQPNLNPPNVGQPQVVNQPPVIANQPNLNPPNVVQPNINPQPTAPKLKNNVLEDKRAKKRQEDQQKKEVGEMAILRSYAGKSQKQKEKLEELVKQYPENQRAEVRARLEPALKDVKEELQKV